MKLTQLSEYPNRIQKLEEGDHGNSDFTDGLDSTVPETEMSVVAKLRIMYAFNTFLAVKIIARSLES